MSTQEAGGHQPRSRLHQPEDLNLSEFFRSDSVGETIVKNDDLEAIVPNKDKHHLIEQNRYWINKPYCFAVVYRSHKDQEYQYYLVEPHLSAEHKRFVTLLKDKIRHSLDYDELRTRATKKERAIKLREKAFELLRDYNLIKEEVFENGENLTTFSKYVNAGIDKIYQYTGDGSTATTASEFEQTAEGTLSKRDAKKIIYYIIRDFINYERIDGLMRDPAIEDISINGWNSSVFIVHNEYDQMITNVSFGKADLDEFVTAMAQKAEKGISKRQPSVDATLADGSRSILMLGNEISDGGSNFTIRHFNEIPFTPIDLINWGTYSIDQMTYLWLAVENGKSAIIAGGTASGKTTTLNAISLFIPGTKRIVSIEDTREINIPQTNWTALTTRESFAENKANDIDEYELLRKSLRMRPNYVVFGEVRGKEATSLFQNLNTGHTTYSTFHAKDPEQVRVRLTTDPISVNETSFSGLDLIINQAQIPIAGRSERRAKSIVELGDYNNHTNKFDIEEAFVWNPSKDVFEGDLTTEHMSSLTGLLETIRHEHGWSKEELRREINRRRVVLSYLLDNSMNSYAQVSSVIQGYMYSPQNVLARIADDSLLSKTDEFREMKNISINVAPEQEAAVPRPGTPNEIRAKAQALLNDNADLYMDITSHADDFSHTIGGVNKLDGKASDVEIIPEADLSENGDAEADGIEAEATPYGYDENWVRENQSDDENESESS